MSDFKDLLNDNELIYPKSIKFSDYVIKDIYDYALGYIEKNYIPQTTASDFEEQPVSFKEFVESKEHMDFLPLSKRQLSVIDFMLGDDPDKIFTNKNNLAVLVYGKGSLLGDHEIYTADGRKMTLFEASKEKRPFYLYSDVNGRLQRALATPAIKKEFPERCYKIITDGGRVMNCSEDHRVLTPKGWVKAKDLKIGDSLLAPTYIYLYKSRITVDYHEEDLRLPIEVFNTSGPERSKFLFKLFQHRGQFRKGAKSDSVIFHVPSYEYAKDVDLLLRTLGIYNKILYNKNEGYRVVINKWRYLSFFKHRLFRFIQFGSSYAGSEYSPNIKYNQPYEEERVVKKQDIGYNTVYTFTVPGTNNYYLDGFIHHNSGKDTLCALILCYICYVLLCMRSPQKYFSMPEGEYIDAVNVAPSEKKASTIFFEKLRQRLLRWRWLKKKYPVRSSGAFISQMKPDPGDPYVTITKDGVIFPKLIRLLAKSSDNESAEGLNTLVYLMDEACFTGDQKVYLASGKKIEIKDIVENKLSCNVKTYNFSKKKVEYKKVVNWFKYPLGNRSLIKLKFKNGSQIIVTDNHRIYTGRGLIKVNELLFNDVIYLLNGNHVIKTNVISYGSVEQKDAYVYDIEVEDNHNYFVDRILVSNSAFADKSNNRNADRLYKVLSSSSKTRFGDKGKGFIISYPRSKQDFTMNMYKKHLSHLHVFTDKAATWEVKPLKYFSGKWFEFEGKQIPIEYKEDFESDPTDAKMMYLAEPPEIEHGFIEFPEKVKAAINKDYRSPVAIEDYVKDNKICKRITNFSTDINPALDYVLTIDLGKKADSAALSMFHKEYFGGKNLFIHDLLVTWVPDTANNFEVSFVNVHEFIKSLSLRFNLIGVYFDQWQSMYLQELLQNSGIHSNIYYLKIDDYKLFKESLYNGFCRLVPDDILQREILELRTYGNRIDHPPKGSKDRIDTVVGAIKLLHEKYKAIPDNEMNDEVEFISENLGKEDPFV